VKEIKEGRLIITRSLSMLGGQRPCAVVSRTGRRMGAEGRSPPSGTTRQDDGHLGRLRLAPERRD
jgi:hypothetical protein